MVSVAVPEAKLLLVTLRKTGVGAYVMFDLSTKNGLHAGDEIEMYHEREVIKGDDGPSIPEVLLGHGQVVKVTPYGATARVTSQEQPAIRVGEHVRITAQMQ